MTCTLPVFFSAVLHSQVCVLNEVDSNFRGVPLLLTIATGDASILTRSFWTTSKNAILLCIFHLLSTAWLWMGIWTLGSMINYLHYFSLYNSVWEMVLPLCSVLPLCIFVKFIGLLFYSRDTINFSDSDRFQLHHSHNDLHPHSNVYLMVKPALVSRRTSVLSHWCLLMDAHLLASPLNLEFFSLGCRH